MRPERMPALVFLGGAVVTEVGGTLCLRLSDGFTRPWPSLGVLAGYVVSILLFSRITGAGLPLGVAYGILTGCGLAAATLLSLFVFGEPVSLAQADGILLIAAGVAALQRPGPETAS
ncbi:DMT family transporter [Amycolatopsis sulphurea]|nr:multidrug efflux SMR transporter [Amycolatopsis sulphurea]